MTTPNPVDALMVLVIEYRHAPNSAAAEIRAAIEASARALAAIPAPPPPTTNRKETEK